MIQGGSPDERRSLQTQSEPNPLSPKANGGGARTTVTPHILEIKPLQLKDFSAEEGGSEPPSANKDGIGGFFGKGNSYNEMPGA